MLSKKYHYDILSMITFLFVLVKKIKWMNLPNKLRLEFIKDSFEQCWPEQFLVIKGSLGGNVPISYDYHKSTTALGVKWPQTLTAYETDGQTFVNISSICCELNSFRRSNPKMKTHIRYSNTSASSPLHPLSSSVWGLCTHTRQVQTDERKSDLNMHMVLLCWPQCPDCLNLNTNLLSTIVDKQCMIHKASKVLDNESSQGCV